MAKIVSTIPVIDPNTCSNFELLEALKFGIFAIKNHGVPEDLRTALYIITRSLFDLPPKTLRKYHVKGASGQRGLTDGKERAIGAKVADNKRSFSTGPEGRPGLQSNIWPSEIPEFKDIVLRYRSHITALAEVLAAKMEAAIGVKKGTLVDQLFRYQPDLVNPEKHVIVEEGDSLGRALHYKAITKLAPGEMRSFEHADINCFTILDRGIVGHYEDNGEGKRVWTQNTRDLYDGLEVLVTDDDGNEKQLPVIAPDNTLVFFVGMMLSRRANGRFKATRHRVRISGDGIDERYSWAFFIHFMNHIMIRALDAYCGPDDPSPEKPISVPDFLNEILSKTNMKEDPRKGGLLGLLGQ